eukprot:364854-Chlamydomonas_euryale.AAC.1
MDGWMLRGLSVIEACVGCADLLVRGRQLGVPLIRDAADRGLGLLQQGPGLLDQGLSLLDGASNNYD